MVVMASVTPISRSILAIERLQRQRRHLAPAGCGLNTAVFPEAIR